VLDPLERQRRWPSAVNFRGANLNTLSPADSQVRVFLLVRSRFFREILARLLRKQTDIAVVGSSHECSAAFKQLVIRPCDVLLLDSVQMLGSLVRMTGAGRSSEENQGTSTWRGTGPATLSPSHANWGAGLFAHRCVVNRNDCSRSVACHRRKSAPSMFLQVPVRACPG
jgi:hypothetical protein